MATTGKLISDLLLKERPEEQREQPQPQGSWVTDLIDRRSSGDPRKKRQPVGFNFEREPFDPASYYRQLGSFRDISRAATNVTKQEAANKEAAERQAAFEASQAAWQSSMNGIDAKFVYSNGGGNTNFSSSTSRRYRLGGVSGNTARAADYFGNKYGIKSIGGMGGGSVPGSDHPKGRALDYMINNVKNGKARGDALAQDVLKNWKKWNVKYVIWNRHIWHPGRGWKKYSGPSAHTDHVHVSFNK